MQSTLRRQRFAELNLWLVMAAAAAAFAWLLPNHWMLWPSFFNEMLIAFALLPLGGMVALRSKELALPRSAQFVLALACVPALQFALGQIRFAGDALLAVLYLVGLALCVIAGARWRTVAHEAVAPCLAIWLAMVAR